VDDSQIVGIHAMPAREGVECPYSPLLRAEKGPCDRILLDKCGEGVLIASLRFEIARKKIIAVELGPAVDKGRNPAEDPGSRQSPRC